MIRYAYPLPPTRLWLTAGRMNSSVWGAAIAFTSINIASVLLCLLAAIVVFALRLHTRVVYRLALYQVLASLFFAMVETFQIIFVHYNRNPEVYDQLCKMVGFFVLYTRWTKLLFTAWITFHLFCFAVLHKNWKRLELLYVVTSVVIPVGIAVVPLTTGTYGESPSYSYCYLYSSNASHQTVMIERFALWDTPAMCILVATSVAMIAMVISVARLRRYMKLKYQTVSADDQFWKALQDLLPLSAFPIFFFVFMIPGFVLHVNLTNVAVPPVALISFNLICISLWSMASGMTLLIHLFITRLCGTGKRKIPLRKEVPAYRSIQ